MQKRCYTFYILRIGGVFLTTGERISYLRNQHGLTQLELAQALHISNSALSQYESGARTVSDDLKFKFASYFDVSLDYLMGRTDMKKAFTPEEVNALPEAQALREVMETLSPEDRQRVLEFGRNLAATSHMPKQQK